MARINDGIKKGNGKIEFRAGAVSSTYCLLKNLNI